ncbi:MAG: esterase [Candidatus Marinimicrobia bacterium]|nr:esterase [Candidatus Neomarinimicrobiota bacterium]
MRNYSIIVLLVLCFSILHFSLIAQNFRRDITPGDTLKSIQILEDNSVILRVYAPGAEEVLLIGSDIPGVEFAAKMEKRDDGVWEIKVGPVTPGAYRYAFLIDNVFTLDPKNTSTSESNMNLWSLFYVQGESFMDLKDVPHGQISEVYYYSKSLKRFRRMHVYTPPGYENGKGRYPVLYLLHGAFDCDDSWPSVGRAGFILDNLIAEGKTAPMIVVMPAGHTGPFYFGMPPESFSIKPFIEDFNNDIKPYIEKHYRIKLDRVHTAIAGLSMGGYQTLSIAIPNLDEYGYIGVFSSGIFGITGEGSTFTEEGAKFEDINRRFLMNKNLKKGLNVFWFATGKDDFLIETTRATVDMFKKYGFNVTYVETEGGHTWINWRRYLRDFVLLLFK